MSGATAWDDPTTGETYILVINEALYYGTKLDHSLINPNQIRAYGIGFWDNPYDKDKGLWVEMDKASMIQMRTKGTKVLFDTRSPTPKELATCHHIQLTSKAEWNPTKLIMSEVGSKEREDRPDGLKEKLMACVRRISEVQR